MEERITPAGAGKTFEFRQAPFGLEDHPRRCGENADTAVGMRLSLGSPPQVRGKLISTVLQGITQRITPAGAGKTQNYNGFPIVPWDHPRRCGENSLLMQGSCADAGSPPQVRGKPNVPFRILPSSRITPAGAGKTCSFSNGTVSSRNHPRRCGENLSPRLLRLTSTGSPPQVRGKHQRYLDAALQRRITPAGAGKTAAVKLEACIQQDHPRRCGENRRAGLNRSQRRGSPPQVRGKHIFDIFSCFPHGITPAGAGKTARA